MEKLKDFIEKKKEKSASRKPRYGTRKLSVGLVSCILGYCIFMSPTVVSAQVEEGSESTPATIEASVDTSDSDSDAAESSKPAANEEKHDSVEATSLESKETEKEAEAVGSLEVAEAEVKEAIAKAPAEEVSEKEETREAEAPATEEKSKPVEDETKEEAQAEANVEPLTAEKENEIEETTPTEEENKDTLESEDNKEAIVEDEKVEETEAAKVEETETQEDPTEVEEDTLEVSDQADPQQLKSEAEATPISAENGVITNVEITIGGAKNGENTTTVNPTSTADRIDRDDTDLNLHTRIDFDIPEGTKSGSTFDIEISDNVNFNGIVKEEEIPDVEYNGDSIATGKKLDGDKRGYRYTFNDTVNDLTDIRVRLEYPLFIDPKKVPNNSDKETVTVSVADDKGTVIKDESKDFKVEYESGVFEYDENTHEPTLSGSANITNVTEDTYEHIIYVNPTGNQGLTGSHVEIKNQVYENEEGKKVAYDGAIFDDDVKDSVKVYKIKDKDKDFNLSYDLVESNLEDVTTNANVEIVEDVWGGPSYLKVDVNQENHDDSVYIVTYEGKRKPKQATKTSVWFTAESRQMDGYPTERLTDTNGGWHWTNEIIFDDPETVAKAEKPHSLGDRVWIDTNKNGIQDDGETGLKDVEVTLKGDDILPVTIKTDENGNYLFKKLKDGTYTVEFTVPEGYEATKAKQTKEDVDDSSDIDSDASVAEGAEVAIATGEIKGKDNMNVDFGVIESEAPTPEEKTYSLGDKVWIDEDKDGIQGGKETGKSGVTVKLTGGDLTEEKTTTTDENGNYKFEGLKNGDYKVEFVIPEGYEATKSDQGSDDTKDSDGTSVNVTIKDANNDTIDLGLIKKEAPTPEEKTYSLGDKVWIDEDKDGIQGGKETGKSGVTVKLTGGDLTEEKTTTTDENGNYKFEGLKNGEYKVEFVIPEGYEATKSDQGDDDTKDSDGKSVTVTINNANDDTIDLGLVKKETPAPEEKTYTLGDKVWIDTDKNGIQGDEEGKSGVTVKLTGGDLTEEKTTTTDENGNYKFEGLKNGEYKVEFVIPEGYEATKSDQGDDDTKDSDGKSVTVTINNANDDTIDLGLVKKETPAPEEKTYTLGDKVWIDTDKNGIQGDEEGKSGVTVKLTGGDLTEEKTTTTDANGKYEFTGLKNGEYKVEFVIPEGYEATKSDQGDDDTKDSDGKSVTVTINNANDDTIDLGLVKKEAPVDPSEPSEPEEPKDTTPLVPLTPAEEVEVERITHHDHKTPGTPVVTEVPSTSIVENEKSVEEKIEKTEETKEVENKEEKVEEVKEAEEVKTVESEDEVVKKVETKEEDKNIAPVSTKDDTKAPKTGDAGILSSLGLGSLAASGLAFIELKKRNKKNK